MAADFAVPEITFAQAIQQTQSLLDQMAEGIAEPELLRAIARLVSSETGARGFFVTYLTDPRPLADSPSPAVLEALRSAPEIVAELLVKNLAMSTAMAVAHYRNRDEAAQDSQRVQRRTAYLIKRVALPQISEQSQKLQESAVTEKGTYQEFLDRWGYDAEQRQAIYQAFVEAIPRASSVWTRADESLPVGNGRLD